MGSTARGHRVLIDRGMLTVSGKTVSVAKDYSAAGLRAPIEIGVVSFFRHPTEAASIFKALAPFEAAHYDRELVRMDLMPGPELKSAQMLQLAIVLCVALGSGADENRSGAVAWSKQYSVPHHPGDCTQLSCLEDSVGAADPQR